MKKVLFLILVSAILLTSCTDKTENPNESVNSNSQISESSSNISEVSQGKLNNYEKLYNIYVEPLFMAGITALNWDNPTEIDINDFIEYYTAYKYYTSENPAERNNSDELGTVPAEELENFVRSHFDLPEDFFSKKGQQKEYEMKSLTEIASCKIVEAQQNDDILILSFEYYSPADDNVVIRKGTLKINLIDDNYKYISCQSEQIEQSSSSQQQEVSSSQSNTSNSENETTSDSNETETENNFIIPNKDSYVGEPPKPDGVKPNMTENIVNQKYEEGKITLSYTNQNGKTEIVTIDNVNDKETIIGYVDNMQDSKYNAANVPPRAGYTIIKVAVHRNEIIEQYIFTNIEVGGNYLGKNLTKDTFNWTITETGAIDYLLTFFES